MAGIPPMTAFRQLVFALMALVASSAACVTAPASATSPDCRAVFVDGVAPRLINPRLAASTTPLCFRTYAVLHSGVTRTPLWSAERLDPASVAAADARDVRDNRFHAESRLPRTDRAELADYVRSGWDRGHMTPSGDTADAASDHDTFSLANIVPQAPRLNRYGWAAMEAYVRRLAGRFGETYVVTGPAFEGGRLQRVGGRVLVPTSTWKAVWIPRLGAGAWIASNDDRPAWKVLSIAQLTARIGIDPFPAMGQTTRHRTPAFPTFGGSVATSGRSR